MFNRFVSLVGESKFLKITNLKVAIIGVGGVGGVCALSLARCGIKNLFLCDFDLVELSNINRQVTANVATLDQFKVDVLKKMILEINPDCNVQVYKERFNEKNNFLEEICVDYVVDAIDDIENKFFLINYLLSKNIKFISSMGMAKKIDPFKLEIVKLSKTTYDPIAKKIREKLRKNYIKKDFYVVCSREEVKTKELGSYINVTAYAGILLSHYIIKKEIYDDYN
ncbi:MAG: ThiF family adenylyltransferase [Bacilli bacterium]|nr:ThiF family adenylyltransferase [Bacilli bacterium]